MWALLFSLVVYGLIGMWDDSIKIFHHQNEGFKPWQKFFLCQVIAAMVFTAIYQHEGFQMDLVNPRLVGYMDYSLFSGWLSSLMQLTQLTD